LGSTTVPANEIEFFVRRLIVFLTSCDARRTGQWEYVGWWEFTNAARFSPEYQRVFGTGLPWWPPRARRRRPGRSV
jgi:hypothetical protein